MDDRECMTGMLTTEVDSELENIAPGTYYLDRIDEKMRRFYKRRNFE